MKFNSFFSIENLSSIKILDSRSEKKRYHVIENKFIELQLSTLLTSEIIESKTKLFFFIQNQKKIIIRLTKKKSEITQ